MIDLSNISNDYLHIDYLNKECLFVSNSQTRIDAILKRVVNPRLHK